MSKGKLYKQRADMIDSGKAYVLAEAFELLKKMPPAKFDETVELTFRLGIDPRHSDQSIRGIVVLPHGTGKDVHVVVVAEGNAADAARAAGANEVGGDDIIERIQGGWTDFDVLIATPETMQKIRRLGRVLGPRGLMPNPKSGTVTADTAAAVAQAKAGRIEYRNDRTGCVHTIIGKLSFEPGQLAENAETVVKAIMNARPSAVKGTYLRSVSASATMSPGVKIDFRSMTEAQTA